jgi:hypothetical protein
MKQRRWRRSKRKQDKRRKIRNKIKRGAGGRRNDR